MNKPLDFSSFSPGHLEHLIQVASQAKRQDGRERTLVTAFDGWERHSTGASMTLVVFSLGAPVDPIHLTDCVGRKFDIPFEHCRTWDVSVLANLLGYLKPDAA